MTAGVAVTAGVTVTAAFDPDWTRNCAVSVRHRDMHRGGGSCRLGFGFEASRGSNDMYPQPAPRSRGSECPTRSPIYEHVYSELPPWPRARVSQARGDCMSCCVYYGYAVS